MAVITIETDGNGDHLFQWLQEDPGARKVELRQGTDDADTGALGTADTIIAVANTAIALWGLTLAIKSYRRGRHTSNRPTIAFVHKGKRVEIVDADRFTIDSFFDELSDDEPSPSEDATT